MFNPLYQAECRISNEEGRIPASGGDRAIRSNLFCRQAAKKDFRFYPLRGGLALKLEIRAIIIQSL
jgi:hypothetical protein